MYRTAYRDINIERIDYGDNLLELLEMLMKDFLYKINQVKSQLTTVKPVYSGHLQFLKKYPV